MLKLYLAAVAAVLSFSVVAQEYQATTTSNAIVRQAPGPRFQQIGLIPAGTKVPVEICFNRGAFCKVTWGGPQPGFVSGELMTIGTTGQTVMNAEAARWKVLDTATPQLATIAAAERCDPWPEPVAVAKAPETTTGQSPAEALPTPKFGNISGQGKEPQLVFLGDSLTDETLAKKTAELLGGRAYRVLQIGGQNATLLSNLFLSEEIAHDAVGIIWIGRNSDPADVDTVIADIEKAVGHVPSGKYIVLDYLSGRYPSEQPGESRRELIEKLNARIDLKFGQRALNVRPVIACADYRDSIHLLDTGKGKVATAIAATLSKQGW